jgi:hypothetical protein
VHLDKERFVDQLYATNDIYRYIFTTSVIDRCYDNLAIASINHTIHARCAPKEHPHVLIDHSTAL